MVNRVTISSIISPFSWRLTMSRRPLPLHPSYTRISSLHHIIFKNKWRSCTNAHPICRTQSNHRHHQSTCNGLLPKKTAHLIDNHYNCALTRNIHPRTTNRSHEPVATGLIACSIAGYIIVSFSVSNTLLRHKVYDQKLIDLAYVYHFKRIRLGSSAGSSSQHTCTVRTAHVQYRVVYNVRYTYAYSQVHYLGWTSKKTQAILVMTDTYKNNITATITFTSYL